MPLGMSLVVERLDLGLSELLLNLVQLLIT